MEKPFLLNLTSTEENLLDNLKDIDYRRNRVRILGSSSLDIFNTTKRLLIFTRIDDPEIDYLGKLLLENHIDYLRVNSENIFDDFECTIEVDDDITGKVGCGGTYWNINSINAIWFRHFSLDTIPRFKRNIENMYVREQWETLFTLINSLGIKMISRFDEEKIFAKPLQINVASKVGLKVPRTVISNRKKDIEDSFANDIIFAKILKHHNIEYEPNKLRHVYGRNIKATDFSKKSYLLAPTIFQDSIRNKKEIRITFFGNYISATEYINVEQDDWHDQGIYGFSMKNFDIPDVLLKKVRNFINKSKLYVGTIDLLIVGEECYFLEVNTNGDWRWIEVQTEQNISENCIRFLKEVI